MKKTHWFRTTLITLVACGIIGLIVAVVIFNADPGRTGAASTVEFSFEGAAEGVAPNGLRFDLSGFTSDEVLNAALKETGLAEKYTADQIRANIIVSGEYPADIVSQMTGYESLLTGDAGKVKAADYHATLYSVALYNDFDKNIARKDLEALLTSIMENFRTRFEQTYATFLPEDTVGETLKGYDYPQQLTLLQNAAARYEAYANQMASDHSDFQKDGEAFSDIAAKYNNLLVSDLQRLSGQITMNALSIDQDRIASQYENQIKDLEIQLNELQHEANDIKALIGKYSRDDIIFVSTSNSLQQISGNSTTYDALVAEQKAVEDGIAENNKELAELRLKLSDIRGDESASSTATKETDESEDSSAGAIVITEEDRAARKEQVERNLASVIRKLNEYTDEFSAFLKAYSEREMNDGTVAITKVVYRTPKLLSGSFIKTALKTAGPFCAVGLMVCLVLLIISRVKEEKRKAA